jgi:integrase/recombinase XerD
MTVERCARHSLTTALENGAQLEDVQKAADIATRARPSCMIGATINPEKAASLFATY